MRIIEKVSEMQQQADAWRREGKRIALVPTMGYLHRGHLTLMQKVRNHADIAVMSVFVNPIQFGPGEDFERYPRDMERDVRLAKEVGVDVAFSPSATDMYPEGYQTHIEVTEVTRPLCGKSRPGHFQGVTTVVGKLFHIVKPHTAIFGEKDFQQLVAIRRMVKDLNMDIEILGHPIVREEDGLAMSSRNVYLNSEQRKNALRLSQSLREAQTLVRQGERNSAAVLAQVRNILEAGKDMRIDYAEMRHPETLQEAQQIEGPTLLALAVFVGATRLIDNCVLNASA